MALLPGGVSVVGAAALLVPSPSSSPYSRSSLADAASAAAEAARAAAGGASPGRDITVAIDSRSGEAVWLCRREPVEVAEREQVPEGVAQGVTVSTRSTMKTSVSPGQITLLAPRSP